MRNQPLAPAAWAARPASGFYWIWLLCLLAATLRLAWLTQTYALTPAPFGCVALLLGAVCWRDLNARSLQLCLVAGTICYGYPILVLGLDLWTGVSRAAVGTFGSSYALWAGNFTLMGLACILPMKGDSRTLARFAFAALSILTLFGVIQSFLMNIGGNSSLYNFWGDNSYWGPSAIARFYKSGIYRATSLFYEPSLYGRACVCLMTVCLVLNYRPLLSIIAAAIGAATAISAGALVMFVLVILMWTIGFRERPARTGIVLVALGVGSVVASSFLITFVFSRLNEVSTADYNSGYVRLALPLSIIRRTISAMPLGAPVGSNLYFSSQDSIFHSLGGGESRMTNGIYEFILYTGVPGILTIFVAVAFMFKRLLLRAWSTGVVIFIMLAGPIVSSSYLSFESTIQFLPVLIAARLTQQRRATGRSRTLPAGRLRPAMVGT